MKIAAAKTQMTSFTQLAREAKSNASIKLKHNPTSKYLLGVTVDRTLGMGAHCNDVNAKARVRTNQLAQICARIWGADLKSREMMVIGKSIDSIIFYAGRA